MAYDDRREHAVARWEGGRETREGGHGERYGRDRVYCGGLENGLDYAPRHVPEASVLQVRGGAEGLRGARREPEYTRHDEACGSIG